MAGVHSHHFSAGHTYGVSQVRGFLLCRDLFTHLTHAKLGFTYSVGSVTVMALNPC